MEPLDRFVPLELDAVVPGEPPRHLGWILATIALCAAMVLLAAGLVPLALAAGSPTRASEVGVSTTAAHPAAVAARTGYAHRPPSTP
ncbi:MAG: hypothetical protein KQH57_11940 [Actinomycetales bacterium]|nr:hypothetical protein [Actinomycetales bacterium]